jgi:DnaJ family protein B protein 12
MESANKQAASECLKKAERKFAEGDLKSSLRLAEKSLRMYQSEEAKELVNRIQSKIASSSSSADTSANGEGVRQRRRQEETEGKDSTGEPSAPSYTPQQQQSVDRVIKCSCFYEVLSVEKEDGVEVIKKAYRKLALQLHPDKNKAPRSSEAFKKVSKAYDTLSDPEKRKMYDQFGEQGLQGAQHGGFSRHYYTTTDEFDADKLFRDFFGFSNFGSGFGTTTFYFDDDGGDNFVFSTGPRTRRVHTGPFRTRIDNRQGNVMFSYLLFLIPMFLVFVLPILVEIFSPPEFRLEKFS